MARDIDIVVRLRNEANQAFQQLQRQLDGVTRSTQTSGQAARQAAGPISGMGVALDGVSIKSIAAATGIAGMGFAAADTGRQMVRTAIDFETAFAGVRKTVDASESEFSGLERGIRNMAMSMPMAASEIAGIAEAAGQLGIQTGAILEFTKTMADLGVATNMTSEQAATSLARLANIVQMPQDQFDNLGSTVVALGNSLATTESELVDMGLRIAAAGDQVGLTEAQILGLAGALSSLGIEAEAGGTAMSRVLVDVSNAAAMGGEKLAAFADVAGMSSDQFRTLFQQDAASAVAAFVEGLNRVSESGGNVFAVLEELGMSDIRVRDALLRMAGGGDILRESLELGTQAWEENIALTTEAEQRYQTTASQLQIIRNSLDDVAYSLFAAGEATGGTSIALEGMTANAQGIANVARSIEWVADAAASVPTVLPTWLQPDGGSGRIAAGWDSVGQSIRNAATIAAGGPLALAGVDWFPAGEDAAETFTLGFENGLSGFPQMVRDALAEIEMSQPFEVGPDGYGPHLDELILGPILSLQPRVREELQELFTMSPEVGASFASSISEMIGQGALSMEEGMSVLSGIPYDTLAPAMERLQSDLQGQLAEALVSGEDTNHIREQLDFVQGMLGETSEFVASSAIGFTEFATASEEAFGRVHDAALSLADVQGIVNDAVSTTAGNMSHWESGLNDIEKAIEPLQQKMEDGIELSKEEAELYDTLTWGAERYAGGIENDLMPAFQDAVANSVEFTRRQDELNQMLEDGTISQEEHKDMMLDAALAGDDASLAAYGLAEAQGDVAEAINGVIDRIRDLLVELGLIPDEHTIKLNLDTSSARAAFDAFMSTVYSSNPTAEAGVGFTQRAGGGTIPPGGEFALVGEEGPELMMLPGGAHIYPHDETMRMIRGYATGTDGRPELSRMEQTALDIIGNLEVVLDPEAVAEAEAELAALWDAKRVAEELGLGDAVIAEIDEQIRAKEAELRIIGEAAGTSVGQGITDQIAAEIEAADLEAAREALTDSLAGLLSDMDGIVSGETGTRLGEQLVEALSLQKVAEQMGDTDLAAYYADQAAAIAEQLEQLGDIMQTPFVEAQIAAEQAAEAILPITEEAFGGLIDAFAAAPEVVPQFIDDILAGLADGTFDINQAVELMGHGAADALIPGLERIEQQLTVDLVNAIIAGNTELEADILEKLELLGILQDELDLTIDKAKEYQALDLWSGPAGAPGTMGAGGGGGGGGYGGGGPQKSTGSSPTTGRNPNYEYNLGPDAHGYHYQTLRQKYGLDMSFQMATSGDVQGAHDFYNNPNQMGYKVEKVQDHLKKNPDLMNDPEYWAHLEEGYGIKKGFVTHGVSVTNVNPDGTIEYSGGGDQITYAPTGTGPPPGVHPLKMARGGVSMGMPLFNTIWGEAGQEAYLPLEGRGADVVAEALGSRITNPLLALLENIGRDDRVEAHDRIDRMEQRQVEMSEWFKVMVVMLERVVDAPFVLDGKEIHRSIGKVVMHTVNMRGSR